MMRTCERLADLVKFSREEGAEAAGLGLCDEPLHQLQVNTAGVVLRDLQRYSKIANNHASQYRHATSASSSSSFTAVLPY
jgi:hypothetical protein